VEPEFISPGVAEEFARGFYFAMVSISNRAVHSPINGSGELDCRAENNMLGSCWTAGKYFNSVNAGFQFRPLLLL
jgi:hypothetical protein